MIRQTRDFMQITDRDKFISENGTINVFGSLFGEKLKWRVYDQKNEIFGLGIVEHCPILMKKQHWKEMYELWPDKTHRTRSNKFRKPDNAEISHNR